MDIENYRPIQFADFWRLKIVGCCLETLALRDGPPATTENYRVKIGVIGPHPQSGFIKVYYDRISFFKKDLGLWISEEGFTEPLILERDDDFSLGPFVLPHGDIVWSQRRKDSLFRKIYINEREPLNPIKIDEFYALKKEICSFAEIEVETE